MRTAQVTLTVSGFFTSVSHREPSVDGESRTHVHNSIKSLA